MSKQGQWRLEENCWRWLQATIKETGLKGSFIINALIQRQIDDPAAGFKSSLARIKREREMQELNDKRAAIEARQQELARELKADRIPGDRKVDGDRRPV